MVKIDARGLSCPQPVVMVQNATNANIRELEVIVNTVVSKENVMRYLSKKGYHISIKEEGDDFIILAKR
ncbi:MAG: sulfurtransferase TusA family protein [Spirochaetes bacterium]|nr:sulfurtransferase TusA family protein [Spirochaetota bacterium]